MSVWGQHLSTKSQFSFDKPLGPPTIALYRCEDPRPTAHLDQATVKEKCVTVGSHLHFDRHEIELLKAINYFLNRFTSHQTIEVMKLDRDLGYVGKEVVRAIS